jgi:FixJ family two-component response regulator
MASRKEKLLAVEDDVNVGHLLAVGLSRRGFTVRVVRDGKSATEMAEQWHPDVLLLDLDIPVLDGFEVLAQLTARRIETRVIIMSGVHADISTIVRCIKNGACDFVPKPIEIASLERLLRRHLVIDASNRFAQPAELLARLGAKERELNAALAQARRRIRLLRQRSLIIEICAKLIYVAIACAATLISVKYGGLHSNLGVGLLPIAILLLLLIPQERLRSLTAKWGSGEASMHIDPSEHIDSSAARSEHDDAGSDVAGIFAAEQKSRV